MNKFVYAMAAAGIASISAANAADLIPGQYASTGQVASNNGSSACTTVGLTVNAPNLSVLSYPGVTKTGLKIYVPAAGLIQRCYGFPAVPAGGLNGFSATVNCAINSINGNVPPEKVNFAFTSTQTDAQSAVGTTKITIPPTSPVGGGCTATVNTTIVRTGK